MTDNATAEKSPIGEVWEDAIQLLCHFHVGQQEWRWLSDPVNGVQLSERQSSMKAFQKVCKLPKAKPMLKALKPDLKLTGLNIH